MSKIAIITDSTASIPPDLVEKHHIIVAPQVLIWENKTYRDRIDIQPDEFYSRLKTAKVMPSTSQVTPATFHKLFEQLLEQDHQILTILISNRLSGTLSSAFQAQDMLPGAPIEIVDSETTAMSMGFHVIEAAKAAAAGASLQECKKIAEEMRCNTGVMFAVDTLEFLHRGGRIGGASRFLGSALNIKPILEISNGRVEPVERVRTRKKSLERMVELIEDRIAGRKLLKLASLHANALTDAQELLELAVKRFNISDTIFSEVSPVIGTNTGPGTVGLAYQAE
jgi:DegV family protein with EDD domain